MSARRKSDWDLLKYEPAKLSLRGQLILLTITALAVVLFGAGDLLVKLGKAPGVGQNTNSSDDPEGIIRVRDSFSQAVEKLRRHRISVADARGAIDWKDGKDRRLYQVSKSRNPKDALIFVALHNTDGSDSPIESMYWDIDFVKQFVPKSMRPDPTEEEIESVRISELISPLGEPPKH